MNALRPVLLASLFLAAAAFAETITGSGRVVTEEREARGFRGVGVALPARVDLVQDGTEALRISAEDNVLPAIESYVEREVLHLRLREGTRLRTHGPIRITVNAKAVESIAIAGSGDVHAPALDSGRLAVAVSGSGDARLGGRAEALEVRISGSGDVGAERLATRRTRVSIAGSGDATVWAREALSVRVAGSGDVRYYGDPSIEKTIAGSGTLRRLGASPS